MLSPLKEESVRAFGLCLAVSLAVLSACTTSPPSPPAAPSPSSPTFATESVVVPDLRGLDLHDAKRELRQVGLIVDEVSGIPGDLTRGEVVEQRPRAGTTAQPGAPIDIVIASTP
jgi:hypothetical protein